MLLVWGFFLRVKRKNPTGQLWRQLRPAFPLRFGFNTVSGQPVFGTRCRSQRSRPHLPACSACCRSFLRAGRRSSSSSLLLFARNSTFRRRGRRWRRLPAPCWTSRIYWGCQDHWGADEGEFALRWHLARSNWTPSCTKSCNPSELTWPRRYLGCELWPALVNQWAP